MKKAFALLLFAYWIIGPIHAQFSIGPKLGLNFTSIYGDETNDHNNTKIGLHAGVVGEYAFTGKWTLQSGLLYSQLGTMKQIFGSMTGSGSPYGDVLKMVINLNYIRLPINAVYKIDLGLPKIILQAGPYFGYGIGGKTKAWLNGHKITASQWKQMKDRIGIGEDIPMGNDDEDFYKAFDFGMDVGVGVQLGRHFRFVAEYSVGLTNISKDVNLTTISFPAGTDKNHGLTLAVVWFFGK